MLEVNTTSAPQVANGIVLEAGPYARVRGSGDLGVGTFDINGQFDFLVNPNGLSLTASANLALGPLGTATVGGALYFETGAYPGLYGLLNASLSHSNPLPGFSLNNAHFQFEINTTNDPTPKSLSGFSVNTTTGAVIPGQTVSIPAKTIMVDAGAQLAFFNQLFVGGRFDLTLNSSGLDLNANAAISGFGNINFGLSAHIGLLNADGQGSGGLVVNASLPFSTGLGLGLFSISATPKLILNTSNAARNGIAPNTYEFELDNASLSVFGLSASGTLMVGVSNGGFTVSVPSSNPVTVNFFGLGGFSAYGFISSNGQFSLTGSVGFDLGSGGNELYGLDQCRHHQRRPLGYAQRRRDRLRGEPRLGLGLAGHRVGVRPPGSDGLRHRHPVLVRLQSWRARPGGRAQHGLLVQRADQRERGRYDHPRRRSHRRVG